MKIALVGLVAAFVVMSACRPRNFKSSTQNRPNIQNSRHQPGPYIAMTCKGENSAHARSSLFKILVEPETLNQINGEGGTRASSINPGHVSFEIVDTSPIKNRTPCAGHWLTTFGGSLNAVNKLVMNGIGGTRVVGQKFVANTNGQTFLDDSGSVINVLENSNQPSKQCPIVDSIEINGENSTITVALVNKNNTSANLVFSNCNQDASDVSTDICSIIACN